MAYTHAHAHAHAHDDTLSSLYAHQRIRRASMRHGMSNGQDIKLTPLKTNSPKTAHVHDSERFVNTQDLVGNCHNPEAGCWHYKNENMNMANLRLVNTSSSLRTSSSCLLADEDVLDVPIPLELVLPTETPDKDAAPLFGKSEPRIAASCDCCVVSSGW